MKLFVYHGSDKIIDTPSYNGGRRFSDFGIGFYTTTNIEKYDLLIGPTADDRMFDTLSLFFENNITVDHCLQSLNSMDLDVQYNIRTSKAIDALTYNSSTLLDNMDKEYYANEVKQKK
ncbi:MAG: DUF3990 domain-containing protein [Clostridium sp.]